MLPSTLLAIALCQPFGGASSPVTEYLFPDYFNDADYLVLPSNSEWVYVESTLAGFCEGPPEIFRFRLDGTVREQIVAPLGGLVPGKLSIWAMRVPSDGSRIAFLMYDDLTDFICNPVGQFHWFVLNTETGAVHELLMGGEPVSGVSYADDGTMAFGGKHPATGEWHVWIADKDGNNPVDVLDFSPWVGGSGRLTRDGKHFFMMGFHPGTISADVYQLETATKTLTKLSPEPEEDMWSVSASADGSRVIYAHGITLHTVHGDGTNHQEWPIPDPCGSVGTTLSGDGEWIFFLCEQGTRRASWDMSELIQIPGTNAQAERAYQQPVSHDGKILAFRDNTKGSWGPNSVWFADVPVLTTYGHGEPGTPSHVDIGGHPGDTYLLAFALGPAEIPHAYGTLLLDPLSLHCIAAGQVGGPPNNIAALTFPLPESLSLPSPVDVYLQALVLSGQGPQGALTNATKFTLPNPIIQTAKGGVFEPAPAQPGGSGPAAPPFELDGCMVKPFGRP